MALHGNNSMNKYTLFQLAQLTQSKLEGHPEHVILGVEDLESATADEASFLANSRYEQQMQKSEAGVIFIHPEQIRPEGKNFLINTDPSRAFQIVIELFNPSHLSATGFEGIHPSAIIHPEAVIGENVTIHPNCVIDRYAKIGKNTFIGAGTYIGVNVQIGMDCTIYPNVTIRENCIVGNRVILQPGVVIGSCGFGYTTDSRGKHSSLKQVGKVVIEDDVEIGANTCIDRARFKTTRISKGTKIDNLVQIAHGVTIGESNLIVSQSGIAGSSKTGRNVVMAGQSALVGHISIADGVILAGRSAASKSLLKTGVYGGAPAVPMKEFNEQVIFLKNVKKYIKRIEALEKKLESISVESQMNDDRDD